MRRNNSNNEQRVSNLERGLNMVREGNLHQADICFDAEMTQSIRPNFDVFVHHGHLLNRLGRYKEANDKFDSFLNIYPEDVSCLFGKGISNIGLLNLDDALSFFEEVIDKSHNIHADAYFYSAIIYCDPFYPKYDSSRAKDFYEMYQIKREDFFKNNPEYFDFVGDDLSIDKLDEYYDEIHNFYNLSNLFIYINQLLEREGTDKSNGILEEQFVGDTPLFDKIESFNSNKTIEDEFKYVGYDKDLIEDLSSKFNGLTIDDEKTLIKIMDFLINSDLSFKDLNDLIRENVLEGNMSIDSFYKNREFLVNSRINEKDRKLTRTVEGQLTTKYDKKINEQNIAIDELMSKNKEYEKENEQLRIKVADMDMSEYHKKRLTYHLRNTMTNIRQIGYAIDELLSENRKIKKQNEQLKVEVARLNEVLLENEQFKITENALIENYEKSNRKNKFLCVLIIFIIICFGVLFLVH